MSQNFFSWPLFTFVFSLIMFYLLVLFLFVLLTFMFYPYRIWVHIWWPPVLCFYEIPDCVNEWVQASLSVFCTVSVIFSFSLLVLYYSSNSGFVLYFIFYFISFLSCHRNRFVFSNRKQNVSESGCRGARKELRGAERGETESRIYYEKRIYF